ncbi:FecR domain-containing protein [Massilia sp. CCM 9210]|uniref:FecR domain-containing protein n=1 Tax=Massilia scottii TaxID=3057166 RepID=UPI0027968C88|nr:FecR domain-containing protein [Massilia sp. CCM 9210]MDQ1817908.1 FecR domain-containing protein [Massilia sp. CCM 9210]
MPAGATIPGRLDPATVSQAAAWMARLWSGEASAADQAACAAWRAAHADHERAWRRLQAVEDKLMSVPCEIAQHTLREPAAAAYVTRRRALQLLGLGVTAGTAWSMRGTQAWDSIASDHSTGTGETRDVTLPDGTHVVLASASAVDLRFDSHERLVIVRAGEILVSTAPDPMAAQRPFRVQTRDGTVQALGTRFLVRQHADVTRVGVLEGAVELRTRNNLHDAVRIGAGKSAAFSQDRVEQSGPVQASAAAWSGGLLVAEDMRVADFVAELARYRPGLLRCDPDIAGMRVSGVFSLRDTDRALRNLALALPVAVAYRTRYWVTVRAR